MIELTSIWPWLALLALGALHGINPGMGWLFAVALGLQERKRRAVWRALLPLAAGHAIAITAVVLLAVAIGAVVPVSYLKWIVAVALLGFGFFRLIRNRHPRWGGMRVGQWDLTVWSFLMASAHGAGLMILPFVFSEPRSATATAEATGPGMHGMADAPTAESTAGAAHTAHGDTLLAGLPHDQLIGLLVTLVHTAGYLLVTGLVAFIVYEKLGLRLLRTHWINFDLMWAAALVLTAGLTLLI